MYMPKKCSTDISETPLADQAESLCCDMSLVYIVIQVHPFKIKILKYLENGERYAETENILGVLIRV